MAFTAYVKNKKTGAVYAYLQEAYRDPVTKRPKSKRTYLGRVDPVTKQIVEKAPPGKRNRTKLNGGFSDSVDLSPEVVKLIEEQRVLIETLQQQLDELNTKYSSLVESVHAIDYIVQNIAY